MVVTTPRFDVPPDHTDPPGESIFIFARALVASQRRNDELSYLDFFSVRLREGRESNSPPGFSLHRSRRSHALTTLL